MTMNDDTLDTIAHMILSACDAGLQINTITGQRPDFDLAAGYDVGARVAALREARGEQIAGWKIGFTNRNIWEQYGATAPMWGPMYDTTVIDLSASDYAFEAHRFAQPRIEPEVALRFASPPRPGMDEADLLGCIDGVAHGFEMVQSVYPDWTFMAPDTVAAGGLHARFCHGGFVAVDEPAVWMERLTNFEIALAKNGEEADRGVAANVLGGPLSALRHFIDSRTADPLARDIQVGDIVTTGTVTAAFLVTPGETWRTELTGLPVPGVELSIV